MEDLLIVVPAGSVHDICDINTPRWPSRRLVQLSVCQVRSRINDVCHLAVVNV